MVSIYLIHLEIETYIVTKVDAVKVVVEKVLAPVVEEVELSLLELNVLQPDEIHLQLALQEDLPLELVQIEELIVEAEIKVKVEDVAVDIAVEAVIKEIELALAESVVEEQQLLELILTTKVPEETVVAIEALVFKDHNSEVVVVVLSEPVEAEVQVGSEIQAFQSSNVPASNGIVGRFLDVRPHPLILGDGRLTSKDGTNASN